MRQIMLGKTGAEVSAISLGTWSYGGANKQGEIPVGWEGQQDDDSINALLRCHEIGINHWDTADVYGNGRSEQLIGSVWEQIPRADIFLATKVGWDAGEYGHFYHPIHMRKQMEQSLINLQTDCVDLLYLHHCNFGKQHEYFSDALETIRRFQEEGKTRFVGLSDWDLFKIMKYIDDAQPDVVQPYRNVMDDTYGPSGLKDWNRLNMKMIIAIFSLFSIFDILFGDRMELWEHGTFLILATIHYIYFLFAIPGETFNSIRDSLYKKAKEL